MIPYRPNARPRKTHVHAKWSVSLMAVGLFAAGCKGDKASTETAGAETTKAAAEPSPNNAAKTAPLLEGMGDHTRKISTAVPKAQTYFNQGLTLAYGFAHREAERSFLEAARLDPDCAICYWGAAWVLGPHINGAMDKDAVDRAWSHLQKAVALAGKASEVEQAFIAALEARYAKSPPEDRSPLDKAFADAMRAMADKYPADADVQVIAAEAAMDVHPWDYFRKSGEAQPWTPAIAKRLETVLARHPKHPGANHYYIHLMEASPHPEKALAAAERLTGLVPGISHMVHMPSHIFLRTGRYADASEANEQAIKADLSYEAQCRAQGVMPLIYNVHNFHFLWASATLEGRSARAIEAAETASKKVSRSMMHDHPMGILHHYDLLPLYAYVRFGQWDKILAYDKPADARPYPMAVWHYARGMAYTGKGQIEQAQKERDALAAHIRAQKAALEQITILEINTTYSLMEIAEHLLAGELLAKQKKYGPAIKELKMALQVESSLNYDEPPDWFYPIRHSLGAVYLEAGKAKAAAAVYREDLETWPENGFSLFGLSQALKALHEPEKAAGVTARFEKAWARADHPLTSSRY